MGCLQQPTAPSGLMATPVSPPAVLSSGSSTVDVLPSASPASFFNCGNASNYIKTGAQPTSWLLLKITCSLNICSALLRRKGELCPGGTLESRSQGRCSASLCLRQFFSGPALHFPLSKTRLCENRSTFPTRQLEAHLLHLTFQPHSLLGDRFL